MSDIVNIISTVGYPIAMSLILMWYIYTTSKQHKEEIDRMTEALNHNTVVLERLCTKLGEVGIDD